ncbi:MAG: hypothetical protein J6M25_01485 [Prevotella sp.]|nr:hypothetical protein [Prevotella sp.]
MNKNIIYSVAILLASLTFGACSSDDDNTSAGYTVETVSQAPAWQVDYSGSESRPDWQEPNTGDYENWSIMLVQLEDALKPYVSGDDLMALFIGGQLRGLTSPATSQGAGSESDKGSFVLKAYGNEADQNVVSLTLSYYCSQLKQTFSRTVQMRYDMGKVYGLEEDLIPQFTLGAAKYPVVKQVNPASLTAFANAAITPAEGDIVAAFVGSECRGVSTLNSLTVFGRSAGEHVTLKYYQAATGKVYTFPDAVVTVQQ